MVVMLERIKFGFLNFHFQPGGLPISFACLCLQLENISCLEFKVASCVFITILNFSLVHSLHNPVTGQNVGMFLSNSSLSQNLGQELTLFSPCHKKNKNKNKNNNPTKILMKERSQRSEISWVSLTHKNKRVQGVLDPIT